MKASQIYWSLLVAAVIIVFMLLSFLYLVRSEYRTVYASYDTTLEVQLLNNDSLLDKKQLTLNEYVHHVDSICEELREIEQHYQHDIDLMIYKTDQWLSFWLAFIGIVVGFFSVLQFYSIYHSEDKFTRMKTEFDEALNDKIQLYNESMSKDMDLNKDKTMLEMKKMLKEKIDNFDDEIKGKLKRINDEISKSNESLGKQLSNAKKSLLEVTENQKKALEDVNSRIEYARSEESINALMSCISSFPDPQMLSSISEKKNHLSYYMTILFNDFSQYVEELHIGSSDDLDESAIQRLTIALNSVKFAAVRAQNVFSEYHQNVTFYKFLAEINPLMNSLISHEHITNLNVRLKDVNRYFFEMVNSIA